MKKFKSISFISLLALATVIFINGCGKSDKDVSTNEKKFGEKETIDTSKFYAANNLQYWQNYPGKSPLGTDMVEVKDAGQIDVIKKIIAGQSILDVYTCEMHPQIHQNYPGTCPLCKMQLKVQERESKKDTSSQKHMKMN